MRELRADLPRTVADLLQLLAVSGVVMGISQTVTKERIFLPLRERLGGKDTWLGYLVSCPYCFSHYVAFALVPLTGTYPVEVAVGGWFGAVLRWFLASILVTVVAAFFRVIFWFVDEAQGLVKRRQKLDEEQMLNLELQQMELELDLERQDPERLARHHSREELLRPPPPRH